MSSRPAAVSVDSTSSSGCYENGEQATRPLPVLTLATLAAEARRIDAERARDEEDSTLTIGPDENRKLLARVFAVEELPTARYNRDRDDEPTLEAPTFVMPSELPPPPASTPASSSSSHPSMSSRPAMRSVPESGTRPRVTAEMARAARATHSGGDRGRREGTFATTENLVVAGIWATALSLFAILMLMATSA